MSELLWYGWVKGYRWQARLLEGLGVIGKKRYKEGSKVIEYCIVDDDGLARLMRYWPDTAAWYHDEIRSNRQDGKVRVEDAFTLSDHNNNQVWGSERSIRLDSIRAVAKELPNVWPGHVDDIVRTYSDVNDFNMRRVS